MGEMYLGLSDIIIQREDMCGVFEETSGSLLETLGDSNNIRGKETR